ncbi:DUF721 domain-containing protein [Nitratireductor mangrovi]|uniref:DUF721 domain-containing protein n=1 Tax=Nitratireductor mangrovi TaxID=2599600 RepID=A0A5B8KYB7_9HYPH|nr:DciA family protein [Nitratireductor mangrovi]QDZ00526.1 DUF721 domain-containing protein [Nitratireductor mangrovi]
MTGKRRGSNPVAVSDLATGILDPVLKKRAGMSVSLVQSWQELVGTRLARSTRPERIAWPRRRHEDDPFEPATLVVACEGAMALHLQHETGEIIDRVNSFFGFAAIGRIRIVQKPVALDTGERRKPLRPLSEAEKQRVGGYVKDVGDEGLRAALERLGQSVVASRK